MPDDTPSTLIDAVRYFADRAVCEAYMESIRWPDGDVTCPECGASGDRIGRIETRHMLRCKDCRKQFSRKVGTIFESSPLPLGHWFVAVWAVANCKNGISSHELARALGVQQRSAWFMLHRIRHAMQLGDSDERFDGDSEADTTYVGGRAKNMHAAKRERKIRGRGAIGKAPVHGVLQRGDSERPSVVRATVLDNERQESLLGEVRRNVRYGANVYTDSAESYGDLALTHIHRAVDHSTQYAIGNVHTNGLENFWSLLKRSLRGTYIAVAPFHLHRYVAEQVYRFNERTGGDASRFVEVLRRVIGKRLTYRVLTAQDDAGFMGLT